MDLMDLMDDSFSTTNYNKALNSFPKCEFLAQDSNWSLDIDYFVAGSSIACSSLCSNPETYATFSVPSSPAEEMYAINDRVESARHIAKRRKIKAAFVDHDLEDTASSPVCLSKFQESENLYMNLQAVDDSSSILLPTQIDELDCDGYSKEKTNTANQTVDVVNSSFNWKDINCTKLREMGLCLVPVSMLLNIR
ncbi:hypothetical protein RND81_12G228200 [Saponaria officinalis]|uniref:Uncharacterized protein n=1 Tax=Saponaria officinalis TaxID=3572 RepID=A0AAW1HEB7_SAPOF